MEYVTFKNINRGISCQAHAKINGFLSFVNSANEIAKVAMILWPSIKVAERYNYKIYIFQHETNLGR